jgi:hypothetical protein
MARFGPVPSFRKDGGVVGVVAIPALAHVLLVYELCIMGRAGDISIEMRCPEGAVTIKATTRDIRVEALA